MAKVLKLKRLAKRDRVADLIEGVRRQVWEDTKVLRKVLFGPKRKRK